MLCPMNHESAAPPPSPHPFAGIHQRIAELVAARAPFAVVAVVEDDGSAPRGTGSRMIVHPDGRTEDTVGGGAVEAHAAQLAREALAAGRPLLRRIDLSAVGMVCGGTMTVFVEPHFPSPALFLLGGGHCAEALHRVAAPCGFRVEVAEDRAELLDAARFPGAALHHLPDWAAGVAALPLRDGDFAVIMTRGHRLDLEALVALAAHPAKLAYLGMIGSRRKVEENFRLARERGVPAGKLAAVRAPIGLDLGGETPAEIAVSIMAEMLLARHGGSGRPMREVKLGGG